MNCGNGFCVDCGCEFKKNCGSQKKCSKCAKEYYRDRNKTQPRRDWYRAREVRRRLTRYRTEEYRSYRRNNAHEKVQAENFMTALAAAGTISQTSINNLTIKG